MATITQCQGIDTSRGHFIIVRRDDNRLGGRYGQHYYVETLDGHVGKVEYLGYRPYDRAQAISWASAVAQSYGARRCIIDLPHTSSYGWSSD